MGQFGNQPDFGTQAKRITATGDATDITTGNPLNPACALYVGTGGDILVTVVGGNESSQTNETTLFKNVPSGTFMPVMVSYVWNTFDSSTATTASDIVGLR